MAMRGRGAGRPGLPSRPRSIISRVYEDFKPMSEWRQEDDHDVLLLHLPAGFQKENIKVTTEDVNTVRVRGERLVSVSENKWSRFKEDYRVPEYCEMRGIRAKFDGGILTITMPRKITGTTTGSRGIASPKPTTSSSAPPKKPTSIEAPHGTVAHDVVEKPDRPQTGRLEDNTLPTSSSAPTKQPTSIGVLHGAAAHDVVEKPDRPQTGRLEDNTLPTSSSAPTKQPPTTKTDFDKGKETTFEEEETKESSPGGGLEKVVTGRGMMNEDRKLLVNVGVGVLIIAALGVQVYYTIGIGKGN